MPENWQVAGFGLYIHWPFCQAKCPYCDFNSHVAGEIDQERWKAAYLSEIARMGEETRGRVLSSVFFGGGTPSLMSPETVAAIIEAVGKTWNAANDLEITLEANPTSVEAGRFEGFKAGGVNRVSMGIQALNDGDLKALGRLHSVSEAMTALDIARDTFDRVSFDLIYARQNQTLSDWQAELVRAVALQPDHLSLYQLTIEPGTAFGDRFSRGTLRGMPNEDLGADLYLHTQDICDGAGLPAYEVSNHAKPGQESRHNLVYWRGGDYAGIGPGAHGRLTVDGARFATETPLAPALWLKAVEAGSGESSRDRLEATDISVEYLMMGLRIREGIEIARVGALANSDEFQAAVNRLSELGMIVTTDGRLVVTDRGRPILNAIIKELLPG